MEEQPEDETESQYEQTLPPLASGKDRVYWPCAPDGFIPNSVVRNLVKPRKPPEKLIPRMKRPEVKKVEAIEEEDDEDKPRIKGNISVILYFLNIFKTLKMMLEQEY